MTAWRNKKAARALCAAALVMLSACGGNDAGGEHTKAKQAIERRDYGAAVLHLKSSLQANPDQVEVRLLLAETLRQLGDLRGAQVEADKLVGNAAAADRAVPLQVELFNRLGQPERGLEAHADRTLGSPAAQARLLVALADAKVARKRLDEAARFLEDALRSQPSFLPALLGQAKLQMHRGDNAAALTAVNALLDRTDATAELWRLKAQLEFGVRRDRSESRRAYERALALDSWDLSSHLGLVVLSLSENKIDEARAQLAKVPQPLQATFAVRYYRAVADLEQGRLDAAFDQVQQLLKVAPDEIELQLLAGQVEYLRGNFLRAESHLSKAFGQAADAQRPRLLLAQTYLQLGDAARAVQTIEPLLSNPQVDPKALGVAAEAYRQLGELDKSSQFFRLAAQRQPQDLRSRAALALGDIQSGKEIAGLAALREIAGGSDDPIGDIALITAYASRGDWEGANAAVDGIERKLPKTGMGPSLRGQLLLMQGKPNEARQAFEEALRRDPRHLPASAQLARIELLERKPQQAVAHMTKAVKANPGDPAARLALLNLRAEVGEDPGKLVPEVQTLVQEQPKLVAARRLLAAVQLGAGDLPGAISTLQAGLAAMPNEAALLAQLADLQARNGDANQATQLLGRLAVLRPRSPEVLVRLAELQVASRQWRPALATTSKALDIRANDVGALRLQALIYTQLGELESARRAARTLEALAGMESVGAVLAGDVELLAKRPEAALLAFRRALDARRVAADAPAKLHRTLRAVGRGAEATAFAAQWEKRNPRDLVFLTYLADVDASEGRHAEAVKRYEQVLAVDAQLLVVRNNLAWSLLQAGQADKALTAADEVIRRAPTVASFHDTRAAVLSSLGRHEQALEAQRRAVSLAPTEPEFRVGLGKRLMAAGKRDEARAEWTRVRQLGDAYAGQQEIDRLLGER